MIKIFEDLEEFKKEVLSEKNIDIESVVKIDSPFLENEDDFTLINLPSYNSESQKNFIFSTSEKTFVYSKINYGNYEKKYRKVLGKKNGESSVIIFLTLKNILKNYSQEFEKIREVMNELDLDPLLDAIEESGRALRKLTDRMEGLVQIVILLKETEIERFNTSLLSFDHEMLNIEARYWLERCRSHVYRVSSLRTKSEMKSNKQLNDTMSRLTVIMTFLTIVSIVVNVPGTVGAIFGIPALSDAYFETHTIGLVITLVLTTLLSVLLGVIYWKRLGLKGA